ncbi:MAG: HAD-IIB family hydrolase [Thermodesulfobacteriota bacterium]
MNILKNKLVVFTDLDGTLLDHHSYSYAPARPALERLKESGTPLVMVSSKTRLEIEVLRAELDNRDPFIPENGGAVFLPPGCGLDPPAGMEVAGEYRVTRFGQSREEITPALETLAGRWPIRALSQMNMEEVMAWTGLTRPRALTARRREFGEAFLVDAPEVDEARLAADVAALGLELTRGGRFYHLLGGNDKGRAVSWLIALYRAKHPGLLTAAFGDAPNDRPMLAAVDRAFLVAMPDGRYRPMDLPGLTKVPRPGPAGFNQSVLELLDELESG